MRVTGQGGSLAQGLHLGVCGGVAAVGYAIAGLGKDLAIAHYQRREGAAATSDGIHRKCHTLPEKLPVLFNRHFHPLDAVRLSA
jgi:hypothetical protein